METGNADTPIGNGALIIKKVHNQEAPNNGIVLEFGNLESWVGQLYIGDNATQGIYYNGWSDGVRGSWKRLADEPITLYDNSSGTTGTVTLSETAANFRYLEIFYSEANYSTTGFKNVKIYSPNGKQAILFWSTHDSGTIIFRSARYAISETSISRVSETQYNTYNTTAKSVTETRVFKVIGYR